MLKRLLDEKAMIVAVIVTVVQLVWSLSGDDVTNLAAVLNAVLTLVGGLVVRQQVKPLSKLPPSMQGPEDQSIPPGQVIPPSRRG